MKKKYYIKKQVEKNAAVTMVRKYQVSSYLVCECFGEIFINSLYQQEIAYGALCGSVLRSFELLHRQLSVLLHKSLPIPLHVALIEAVAMAALTVHVKLVVSQRLVLSVHIVTCIALLYRQDPAA